MPTDGERRAGCRSLAVVPIGRVGVRVFMVLLRFGWVEARYGAGRPGHRNGRTARGTDELLFDAR
jgi:hypothetical protein